MHHHYSLGYNYRDVHCYKQYKYQYKNRHYIIKENILEPESGLYE